MSYKFINLHSRGLSHAILDDKVYLEPRTATRQVGKNVLELIPDLQNKPGILKISMTPSSLSRE